MRMHGERKMPKNYAETPIVFVLQPTNYSRNRGAGWALKITKYLQRNSGVGLAVNMRCLFLGRGGRFGSIVRTCVGRGSSSLLRTVKHRTRTNCEQRRRHNNNKGKITLHGKIIDIQKRLSAGSAAVSLLISPCDVILLGGTVTFSPAT